MTYLFRKNLIRTYLMLFNIGIGFFFLYASISFNRIDIFLSSFIYLFIYLFIIYIVCRLSKNLLVFIVSLLFSIGFLLKPGLNYLEYETLNVVGWEGIGTFGFSAYELTEMYMVVLAGILGVLVAIIIFNSTKYMNSSPSKVNQLKHGKKTNFHILFLLWLIFYLSLVMLMDSLHIGIHGLSPSRVIGYKLIGIMVYLRDFVFPIIGVMLMDISHNSLSKKNFSLIFLSLLCMLLLVSVFSLSRGAFIIPLTFLSFYIICNGSSFGIRRSDYLKILLLLILAIFFMNFVNNYRTDLYQINPVNSIVNALSSISFKDLFTLSSQILTSRIEGSRELMAVIASPLNGIDDYINIFFNTGKIDIPGSVFGFNLHVEGRAYGITLGALGFLYASKSFLLVFLGMFFQMLLILYINLLFSRKGYPISGFYFSCLWIVIIWSGLSMFFIYKYIAVLIILLLFIKYLSIFFVISKNNKKIV